MISRIFAEHREEQAFHWIGAATVTLWPTLPPEVQEVIVKRALEMADAEDGAEIKAFVKQQGGEPSPRS
ncbi:MAG TPA: hypothetical protein VFB16_10980 [Bauldia sp.]|nr:hypothetical protein [Bauldia sp.]